jgi:hypothetical protein
MLNHYSTNVREDEKPKDEIDLGSESTVVVYKDRPQG